MVRRSSHPWDNAPFRIASSGTAKKGLLSAVSIDGNRMDVLWEKIGGVAGLAANWWHGDSNGAHFHNPADGEPHAAQQSPPRGQLPSRASLPAHPAPLAIVGEAASIYEAIGTSNMP